ncbi:MAG: TrkH family potassium uptake protein [Ruminococcaceae bacterium]|nr:TrkH family potassium uptake protein [Oscillospiraceae bacterium]
MNKRMIAYILGILLLCEAGLLLLPTVVSLIYGEAVITSFLATIALLAATGLVLIAMKPKDKTIYARHGLVIVSLGWILMSLFGALPFYFSGEIPSYLDAVFEAVSGFTTTGSSILTDVEALSKSMLFWRSFTHWIGGMGVLVFMMAVLPLAGGGGDLHLMKAESPGPNVSKLVPKSSKTARILYGIYLALTVLEILILLFGGMPLFDSVTITFGTAGTGGFGVLNSSIAEYSTFCQGVITVFMVLFGINFNFYFLILCKKFKDAFKSEEVWTYLAIMISAIVVIAINTKDMFTSFSEALHHSAFQVSSVMTTTGFATTDFNQWPELSRIIMLAVMCVGACAGSTGGGLKVSRVIILLKSARREFRRISHPRSVKIITFDGNRVSDDTIRNTFAYFFIYAMIFASSVLVVSLDNFDFTTTTTSVIATLNNIGPGLNMVGATGNYSEFSFLSKLVLIADMLLGRLEIFPLLFLFAPSKQKVKIFSRIRSKLM